MVLQDSPSSPARPSLRHRVREQDQRDRRERRTRCDQKPNGEVGSQGVYSVHTKSRRPVVDEHWGEMTSESIRTRLMAATQHNVLFRHPILRRLYIVFFLLVGLFLLVPCWAVYYLPKWNRPRSSWSLTRCLRVRWARRLCSLVARCEIDYLGRDYSRPLDPSLLTHSHPVTIPAAPATWLRGYAAAAVDEMHATSARGEWVAQFVCGAHKWNHKALPEDEYGFAPIPGFWFTGRKKHARAPMRPLNPGDPVVLNFHGGGYVVGTSAETDLTSSIPKALVAHTPIRHVLSVDYRLAPTAPWPLPLLDAISAYAFLISEGVDERDIIFAGDSAGGHLALALARFLRDEGPALGLRGPRGMILFSPWCDMGFTHMWTPESLAHNMASDMIDDQFGLFAVSVLTRSMSPSAIHETPYLSPASLFLPCGRRGPNSFENFPPVFSCYGGAERLALEISELYARIQAGRTRKTATVNKFICSTDAIHDFTIFPHFSEEASDVYAQLDTWLRDLLADDALDDDVTPMSSPLAHHAHFDPLDTTLHVPDAAHSPVRAPRSLYTPSPAISPALSTLSLTALSQGPSSPRARAALRASRAALRTAKSPRLASYADTPRLMVGDMQAAGLHLLDAELEGDAFALPTAVSAALSPFTSPRQPRWDWEEEVGGESEGDSEEDKK